MSVVMASDDAPATARLDFGSELDLARGLIRQQLSLDFRPVGEWDARHWGHGSVNSFGPIQAMVATAGPAPVTVERTPAFIRDVWSDTYKVELLLSGNLVVAQDDREAALRPGDFAICDMTRPLRLGLPGLADTRVMALLVPRALIPVPPREVARLTAVSMAAGHRTSGLVSTVLQRLACHLDEYEGAEAVRISTVVVDLLATAFAGCLDLPGIATPEQQRELLRHRVYGYIEERLGDPRLSPATIAAAHHVSLRYLYKVFEADRSTVAGWIRQRRLEACRRDLCDPRLRGRPVSAIAARWGLRDATQFSRAFRGAFGVPPARYRDAYHSGRPAVETG
jgi:AraC-like DNA-binding protein